MQSKKVKQAIALAADMLMMCGKFKLIDVARNADKSLTDADYSIADLTDRRLAHLKSCAKSYVIHPLSAGDTERLLINVPKKFRADLPEISLCMCSKPGRDAEWVFSMFADLEAWDSNVAMKDAIAQYTAMKADDVRFVRDMLKFSGKKNLAEFYEKAA